MAPSCCLVLTHIQYDTMALTYVVAFLTYLCTVCYISGARQVGYRIFLLINACRSVQKKNEAHPCDPFDSIDVCTI